MANDLSIVLTEQPDLVLTLGDSFIGSAYSPQVAVEDIEGGHRVTVTYRDAEQGITTKTFDVLDGAQGPKGDDGYSPTVAITDTADGHVVTITDATGAHSYTVPTYASEEAARESAEDARSRAEGARVQAEGQRAENERQRVAEWATMQQEVEAATEGAENVNATVTKSGITATISVTDRDGTTHTATVSDGETGPKGEDGVSPTASVQRVTGGAEVTVTDASGTTTAMLYDATIEAGSITDAMLAPDGIKAEHAWLWGNQLTGELDGNPATASDAHAAPMLAMGVLGKSEQESTTGKNLLDRSTEETGYINSSGNPGSSTDWRRSDYIPVVAGTTYTFTPNSTSGGSAYGCWYDADQGVLSTFPSGPTTQTAPTGAAYVRVSYRATSTNVQLEVGTAATAYEPYTGGKPTPRPDYPQEIRSVVEPVLTVAGKNLLDPTLMLDQAGWHTIPIYVPEGTVLTMSTNHNTGSAGTAGDLPTYFRQPSGVQGTGNLVNLHHAVTQTVGEQGFVEVVQRRSSGTDSFANYEWQIEVGSTATAYEPYEGHTVTLPVTLRSLPDGTRDTLALTYLRPSTREGWAWYSGEVTRRVSGAISIPAFDNFANNSAGHHRLRYILGTGYLGSNSTDTTNRGMANRFIPYYNAYNNGGIGTFSYSATSGQAFFILNDSESTLALANAWLAENPIEIYLAIATPTTETLDPIELPILPSEHVTMWATADATPTLNVEYVRDSNLVIASLEAAIADLATS